MRLPWWVAALMALAAWVDWRVWRGRRFESLVGDDWHTGRMTIRQQCLFLIEWNATMLDGRPVVRWDGWRPGRYV